MTKLEIEISKSKSKEECERLLSICDDIANKITVLGYTVEDLPTKETYEKFALKANHINIYQRNKFNELAKIHKYPRSYEIQPVKDCLFYPSFVGVDIVIEFGKKPMSSYSSAMSPEDNNVLVPLSAHLKNSYGASSHVFINDKIKYFIKHLKFKNPPKNNISKIILTGKFIYKGRFVDNNGKPELNHFNLAMEKINSNFETFKLNLEKFDFLGFEINNLCEVIDVEQSETIINKSINQYKSLILLKNLICVFFDNSNHPLCDYSIFTTEQPTIQKFYKTYLQMFEKTNLPTNGLVYCDKSYVYEDKFKNNKFIWLSPKYEQLRIVGLNFKNSDIGIIFKLECSFINLSVSDVIEIDISPKDLESFIEKGIGENAICSYDFTPNGSKYISSVLIPSENVFKFPTHCPNCKCKLIYEYKNDKIDSLLCKNDLCSINSPTLWFNLINRTAALRSNAGITLKIFNAKGSEIKRITKKYLVNLSAQKRLKKADIELISPNLFEEFEKLSLIEKVYALSLVPKQSQAKKFILENDIKTFAEMPVEFIWYNK